MSDEEAGGQIVYASWGGAGRVEAVRRAYALSCQEGHGFVYLAVLDGSTFDDLDSGLVALVREELEWLLSAQVRLVRSSSFVSDQPTRVIVRSGDVVDEICDVVEVVDAAGVLIGEPIPLVGHDSVAALVEAIHARSGAHVRLIAASASEDH